MIYLFLECLLLEKNDRCNYNYPYNNKLYISSLAVSDHEIAAGGMHFLSTCILMLPPVTI